MLNPTSKHSSAGSRSSVIEVDLKNAYDSSEYANLEKYLNTLSGVQGFILTVHAGWPI